MNPFFQLHPIQAVQDHLRSSAETHVVIGAAGVGAWLVQVNWAAVFAAVGVAVTTIIGGGMQLYKQWELIKIQIEQAKRKAAESAGPSDAK